VSREIWRWLQERGRRYEPEVMVVNLTTLPIGQKEIRQAFAVSENVIWWRAIMQTLETRRQEQVEMAGAAKDQNNPYRMAGHVEAAVVLGQLIADLQKNRKMSVSE